MSWWDFYKLFYYSFQKDPLDKKNKGQRLSGAGVTQPDAIPDIRNQDGSYWGSGGRGVIRLRDTNDFIDLSTITNRQNRLKEYERLRNVPEIEQVMTIFADNACVAGSTIIRTPYYGDRTIEWLEKHKKKEEFLVYCWDFTKQDYTLGWAYDPRIVKRAKTIKVKFDDGTEEIVTPDHRVLLRNQQWIEAGNLRFGMELMPFYKVQANHELTNLHTKQFPRIFTFNDGWKHERQFIDEWNTNKKDRRLEAVNRACKMLSNGLTIKETSKLMGHDVKTIRSWLKKEGFTVDELRALGKKPNKRRVVGVEEWNEMDVYDLSVKGHANFAGQSIIFHNCQKGENGHVFDVMCKNEEIKKELEWLFFNRKMLNCDRLMWDWFKTLFISGDKFFELCIDPEMPSDGVAKIQDLPSESMYRIETTKGKLVEFQQGAEGPDYESLTRAPVAQATDPELQQSKAIRFTPEQIVHIRIGDNRKTFYPYGQSLIEPARGPAHQLRLMEDAMLVYRLTRAPERRVFYIDVAHLPPYKAEAFMDRLKDQLRKKKVSNRVGEGASGMDEKWHAPAADEDFWIPIRPSSNTRIETLPGAQNLGEIDDAVYFRNKLFTALNFPKNYFNNEDPQATRITLSAQDVRFAQLVERLQSCMADGIYEIAHRHLQLMGYPEKTYEDLQIKMTPPSDWRELTKQEAFANRINNATALASSFIFPMYDVLTKIMKCGDEEAQAILARMNLQKLQDLRLQIFAQNPQLLGIGVPGQGETEMGAEPGGPSPMLGPTPPPGGPPDMGGGGAPPPGMPPEAPSFKTEPSQGGGQVIPIPEPSEDDIQKYDLELQSYDMEIDREEPFNY